MEKLFETDFVEITSSNKYLKLRWKQYVNDEGFQGAILKLADLSVANGIYKLVIDASRFRGTSVESRQFVNDTFNKISAERGRPIIQGLVPGDDATGRFSLNKIVKDSEGKGANYKFFSSVGEAEAWAAQD